MADNLRNIFGTSLTTAFIRIGALGSNTKTLCEAWATAFGLQVTDGDTIYTTLTNSLLGTTIGFGGTSHYANYQLNVLAVVTNSITDTNLHQQVLAETAGAMIFGYALDSGTPIASFITLLNKVLSNVANQVNNNQVFQSDSKGNPITPFTASVVQSLLAQNQYSNVVKEIMTSPRNTLAPLVNYNWYDASSLFAGPDLNIMKDVENQYYYISGTLNYPSTAGNVPDCIQDYVTISTYTGALNVTYIRNTPCVDRTATTARPVSGIKFYRIFNDGPASSGDFNTGVLSGYIGWDKAIMSPRDYSSNSTNLYTYNSGAGIWSGLFEDANGPYSLPYEYQNIPGSYSCVGQFVRMHIGDNLPRVQCWVDGAGHCHCSTGYVTGFKAVNLELNPTVWSSKFLYAQTNPVADISRVLKRALNIQANPYLATLNGSYYYPYYTVGPNTYYYAGLPQLNGGNTLPEFLFFETFDNATFGDFSSLCIYPSLSTANGNAGSDSQRSYQMSPIPLFSGKSAAHATYKDFTNAKVPFAITVGSAYSIQSGDTIWKQFFGMGDNFGNLYTTSFNFEQNAGFFYTGIVMTDTGGNKVNPAAIISSYSSYILGSPVPYMWAVTGYTTSNGTVLTQKIYGQDSTGGLLLFYYFDNTVVPPTQKVPMTGWPNFAPLPSNYEANSYPRLSGLTNVENYLPRYSQGPFSDETRQFLYPNAALANSIYQGKLNGIPKRVTFNITVREETVREFFAQYEITPDGVVVQTPTIVPVIRTDGANGFLTGLVMTNMFSPDTTTIDRAAYDFNLFDITDPFVYTTATSMVDYNYAPTYNSYSPSGKDSLTYDFNNGGNLTFKQGILITGNGALTHQIMTGTGKSFFSYTEKPKNYGLYHAFRGFTVTGVSLRYVPPIFNLQSGSMVINDAWTEVFGFGLLNSYNNLPYAKANGKEGRVSGGIDPLYFEYVGGRKGSPAANNTDGGYNTLGFIGDKWNGMIYNTYSVTDYDLDDTFCRHNPWRTPQNDDSIIAFNMTPTGTTFVTKGMWYSPFWVQKSTSALPPGEAFGTLSSVPPPSGGRIPLVRTTYDPTNKTYAIDVSKVLPVRNSTGNEWWSQNGEYIGPFDRDVEIALSNKTGIIAYTQLWVNGQMLSAYPYDQGSCSADPPHGFIQVGGTVRNDPAIGRDAHYSILGIVPSGDYVNINCYTTSGSTGVSGKVGILSGQILIKAHNNLYTQTYDSNLFSGEQGWLDPYPWADPVQMGVYTVPHGNIQSLLGTHTFVNKIRTGILYPMPGSDFTGLASVDPNGNIVYPSTSTVEVYWRRYAHRSGVSIFLSGYRESSRISFTITNINLQMDQIPYQQYRVIVPSGVCIVSGEMGHNSQAEASIYSEGLALINTTPIDPTTGIYNPIFVSDVLGRLPWWSGYASSVIQPVKSAPSIMEQRTNVPVIQDGQSYTPLMNTAPNNYNKMLWPALSDLETLNAGETMEAIPPDDGNTFNDSTMLFSASQGQPLPNGLNNPQIIKQYSTSFQYQMYDSLSTDALWNSGKLVTNRRGTKVTLSQSTMSGILAPQGVPLVMAVDGLT